MSELTIGLNGVEPIDFYGVNNSKLTILKGAFPKLHIVSRGDQLKVTGSDDDMKRFQSKVSELLEYIKGHGNLSEHNLKDLLQNDDALAGQLPPSANKVILHGTQGAVIRARTKNQKSLVDECAKNDIVFAIGPAGTGKTYTAVALAVRALKDKRIKRIILTRPAVEAGESLGFLPGDLKEKIDPYLRPLYDALDDMIPPERLANFMENRVIEIAPLAFMRGRTLDKAFIILDEAQNATLSQLKMFLTRIGPEAKCVITGDVTQVDLPKKQKSGLLTATRILKNVRGISVVELNQQDVIRHRLVKKIIQAFDLLKRTENLAENHVSDFSELNEDE